eukprot:CAMPEP_0170778330 /NCGR_PEP_ID=MMETSP0733-20121128/12326_1 /TAXON_ID=186038 /ORGANISM="Fragilariopsis kerguelensis, Strain L26-C5" /LENGTH=720 /DNA_ID=CAMNT_0011121731 /DNA_START=362 /DNA_END=2524 /DNA_ORIENTATION=+
MIFSSNDLSIDANHRTLPHAHANAHNHHANADAKADVNAIDETDTLLGRRGTNSSTTTTRTSSSSRVSRFEMVGFLFAFFAFSSSTFLFLLNRGTMIFPTNTNDIDTIEVQVAKEQRPSSHDGSLSSENVVDVPTSLMTSSLDASETSNHALDGSSLSDGTLKQPEVMKTTSYVEDYCPIDPNKEFEGCQASTNDVYVLTLEKAIHETTSIKMQSRLYNGKLPGHTIKIKRGETLKVLFKNELTLQDSTASCKDDDGVATNLYCEPDHTNLHYHGFQGSGEEPSDDSEMVIPPLGNREGKDGTAKSSQYSYKSVFTKDHMPGTHWVHAHPHGGSRLQVGGGAAFALIVEDDHETFPIPKEVKHATDVVLVVQHFSEKFIKEGFGGDKEDAVFKIEKSPSEDGFRLVNGQYQPTHYMQPGGWHRFRVIYAGWSNIKSLPHLNLSISKNDHDEKCETYLLAKDGIYLLDYPRPLDTFPIPASGRADIMVRCKKEGTYVVKQLNTEEELFTIKAKGPLIESDGPTRSFFEEKRFPLYLQSVRYAPVNPDCSCSTRFTMDKSKEYDEGIFPFGVPKVNDKQYVKKDVLHTIKLREVIERELTGVDEHPYHHHVYPFQLTKGFDKKEWEHPSKDASEDGYFQNGDWHDVIVSVKQKNVTIKYRPVKILGKMMVHCHILAHEDLGMIAVEKIVHEDGNCSCDSLTMSNEEFQQYSTEMAIEANKNN